MGKIWQIIRGNQPAQRLICVLLLVIVILLAMILYQLRNMPDPDVCGQSFNPCHIDGTVHALTY